MVITAGHTFLATETIGERGVFCFGICFRLSDYQPFYHLF